MKNKESIHVTMNVNGDSKKGFVKSFFMKNPFPKIKRGRLKWVNEDHKIVNKADNNISKTLYFVGGFMVAITIGVVVGVIESTQNK